jgi:hypothetical protein
MLFFLSSFYLIYLPFLTQVRSTGACSRLLTPTNLGSGEACTCLLIVLITISCVNMSKDNIKSVYLIEQYFILKYHFEKKLTKICL